MTKKHEHWVQLCSHCSNVVVQCDHDTLDRAITKVEPIWCGLCLGQVTEMNEEEANISVRQVEVKL